MVTRKDRCSGYFSILETMNNRERRRFQNRKLKRIIAYAYEKAPAIKKKFFNRRKDFFKVIHLIFRQVFYSKRKSFISFEIPGFL